MDSVPQSSNVSWIAKHDRHRQLINPAVYERETQNRLRDIEETRKLKAVRRDERERRKVQKHLQRYSTQVPLPGQPQGNALPVPSAYEISIHGIRFLVSNGGSRLVKISGQSASITAILVLSLLESAIDPLNATKSTPKRATVGGVTFRRTKSGNLVRAGIVSAKLRYVGPC